MTDEPVAEKNPGEVSPTAEADGEATTPEITPEVVTPAPTSEAAEAAAPADKSDKAPAAKAKAGEKAAVEAPPSKGEAKAAKTVQAPAEPVEGKVIGWNDGGFHVVVDGKTGFCPRSEMEIGKPLDPKEYLDQTFLFRVLRIERKGKRVVLSRRAQLQGDLRQAVGELRGKMKQGAVLMGSVVTLTDFGAFVDLGGVQGLLHVSEISRRRVKDPREVLQEGQEVEVKVLKIEQNGRRISLSMKALEPDPWKDVEELLPQGKVVTGRVERTEKFGAFIEVAPGLTGLLPSSAMAIPRDASAARIYHPGKEVSVQVLNVDPKRRRISLGLEGSSTEGSQADFDSYRKQQSNEEPTFNALAAALERARRS